MLDSKKDTEKTRFKKVKLKDVSNENNIYSLIFLSFAIKSIINIIKDFKLNLGTILVILLMVVVPIILFMIYQSRIRKAEKNDMDFLFDSLGISSVLILLYMLISGTVY